MEIPEILEMFTRSEIDKENFYSQVGTVTNVDSTKRTCDFQSIDGQAKRSGIRLQSVISETFGFVLIPKNNTKVMVTFFDSHKGFVSLTAELEKILIDTDLVQFNGGSNDGLININDLVTNMNVIEAKLDTFIVIFNAHVHPGVTTGGAVTLVTTTLETVHGQTSNKANLGEDTKVTH